MWTNVLVMHSTIMFVHACAHSIYTLNNIRDCIYVCLCVVRMFPKCYLIPVAMRKGYRNITGYPISVYLCVHT